MIEETIARRYAKALIDIGKDDGKFEDYGRELSEFKTLIDENRDLKIFLENPMFETSKRLAVTEDLIKKMQLSPISGNFILLLVQKKRISYLPDILVEYQRQIDVISNIARASITSATQLSDSEINEIQSQLEKITSKNVKVSVEVDQSLIGGIIAKVGDEVFDGSLRTSLMQIKTNLIKE